jgi:hypothetical protein
MAKLTAKARKNIKPSKFALPGKNGKPGKYPVEDRRHAADAKARATQMVAKGKLSPSDAAKIRHKADAVLGMHDTGYHNQDCK